MTSGRQAVVPALGLLLLLAACGGGRAGLVAPTVQPGAAPQLGAGEPVRVDYYMEALCPFCANFTRNQLKPMFDNGIMAHVELDIIPWGNARVGKDGATQCQHGPLECQLNKVLSCAIAQNPLQDDFFPFFLCVEEAFLEARGRKGAKPLDPREVAQQCAVHAGIVPAKLMACYEGELGNALQRLAAQRTDSLKPAHRWVPWVVVNGVPLLDDNENLQTFICVAYTGRDRPKACLDIPEDDDKLLAQAQAPPGCPLAAASRRCMRERSAAQQEPEQQPQQALST